MLVKSQVKYIQSLSQKKLRDAEGVFVAEGPKIINELLSAENIQVKQLFALEEWIQQHPEVEPASLVPVSGQELERLSFLQTPHLVTGIFHKPVFPGNTGPRNTISLLLDTIQDPGNMGTIIRCADWFGIRQIICSEGCADAFNPKVVQSSMGSVCRVQVQYEDLASFIQQFDSIPVYAATLEGTDLRALPAPKEGLILIGNESTGIRSSLLELCKYRITIPRKGQAESLNAAVATGIVLSHLVN